MAHYGAFRLSGTGSVLAQDPAIAEYLRAYGLPLPPDTRYGCARVESSQKSHRVRLFAQAWVPGHAYGTVLFLHGYSEHAGNYARLIREFTENQLAVIAVDHRGHGLSEGPACHVESPHHYVEDVETALEELFPKVLPNRPLFLWAHSMGGLVALQTLLRGNLSTKPTAAVLSSPLLGFPELHGAQKIAAALSPLLAKVVPALPVTHGISPRNLSHDGAYLAKRTADPLVKRVTTPSWFESMKKAVAEVQGAAPAFRELAPTLLLLAGQETVTNLDDARRFAFRAYAGQRHKVIEFPGAFHELEKEPSVRPRLLSESLAWFRSHS